MGMFVGLLVMYNLLEWGWEDKYGLVYSST